MDIFITLFLSISCRILNMVKLFHIKIRKTSFCHNSSVKVKKYLQNLKYNVHVYRAYSRPISHLTINAAPLCENYAKLYFDAKHLEKVLNSGRRGVKFLGPFLKKMKLKWNIFFFGGAPTCICHFFHPSFSLSVCLSITHHISGTVHHNFVFIGPLQQFFLNLCFSSSSINA